MLTAPDTCDGSPQAPLREKWLQDMFVAAGAGSGDPNATIDQESCVKLIQKLDPNVETDRVLHKIQVRICRISKLFELKSDQWF